MKYMDRMLICLILAYTCDNTIMEFAWSIGVAVSIYYSWKEKEYK